jgi:Flp pilus assembly protein TadG
MVGTKRAFVTETLRTSTLPGGRSRRVRVCPDGERGQALVELAFAIAPLMLMFTGICSFGIYLEQDLQLTDAVNIAGKQLAISRGNATDPCSQVSTTVGAAAPLLNSGSMTFTYSFNGNPYSGTTCTSGAANLIQGDPITISVQYPCTVTTIYANLLPGCTITAQITEMVQ